MDSKNSIGKHLPWLILLVLICVTLFCNTFQNTFIWDGKRYIVNNEYIKDLKNIPFFFTPQYWKQLSVAFYRPMSMTTFALDYFLWELNPVGFHLTNLLLHILNVILVYFLVLKLEKASSSDFNWQSLFNLPFLTAAFFAAQPVHVESITWIKSRSDPLVLLFCLLSFLFFIRYVNTFRFFSYSMTLFCFILALLSKEIAVVLPFLLVFYSLCFLPQKEHKRTLVRILPFSAALILYAAFKIIFSSGQVLHLAAHEFNPYIHILTVFKTIGYYVGLLVFPINLNADRIFSIPESLFEPAVYISAALSLFALAVIIKISLLIAKGVRIGKDSKLFCFAMLWIFLTLLPISNIIFLASRPISEQRLYMPSLGFCLVLAIGIKKFSSLELDFLKRDRVRQLAALLFIIILAFYSVVTVRRNFEWKNPLTFWTKTAESSPFSLKARNNLGNLYENKGFYDKAIAKYKEALSLNPNLSRIHYNLGNVYKKKNLYSKAITKYKDALGLNPANIDAHYNLAIVYEDKGLYDKAIEKYKDVLNLDSDNIDAHGNLGNLYEKKGFYGKAIKEYRTALELNPQSIAMYNNLGYLYVKRGVELDKGIRLIKEALLLDSENAAAMDSLGWAYYKKGMFDKALEQLEMAVMLLPDNAEIQEHLDAVYRALGRVEPVNNPDILDKKRN
ncbi:MAG: tetratricopeptide repeat protein [Candidatus Omnitrophica bacterium]|nr:tetratricopeptide repeat protein [Candidatus Omnitrophota bacterium]